MLHVNPHKKHVNPHVNPHKKCTDRINKYFILTSPGNFFVSYIKIVNKQKTICLIQKIMRTFVGAPTNYASCYFLSQVYF